VLLLYLKRLDIQGFKSFPDKISLEFGPGITSVVGPNGSGKSNIADAIRWVLGEQSIKTLRGSKMEDVIFSGTEHRKPLGFAEASLTLDNTEGVLPVEFTEVTVTRRVFRSGESEYMINKTPCRLKDINEMLFDTGLGKDGYSVIGQGRVDEILSTRSEDRRHIFEEASGIMKFKVRKLEAEKKLESTKQNLLRINDIINELENQLEPLKQQSDTAKKYLALRESLKELEVNVFIENISKYKEKLGDFEEQYTTARENIEAENNKLENITRANRQKTELMKSLEEKLNIARQEFYSLEGNLERCNSEIRLNEEKISNLTQNIHRLESEIAEVNGKVDNLAEEEQTKLKKLQYLNDRYNEYSSLLAESEKRLDTVIASLDESERHIENLKSGIMDKLDVLSDKKTQINNIRLHIDNINKRQKSIEKETYQLHLENDRENLRKEELQESVRKAKDALGISRRRLEDLNKVKTGFENDISDKRKQQNTLRSKLNFKVSRHRMLEDMEQNLEGYNRSVKAVLQASNNPERFGKGIHGALAQLLKVEPKYEAAIEMSLGNALQNIVTETEEDAKKAIEFLKEKSLGRATFLPISSVNGKYLDIGIINDLRSEKGFCGIASDLLSYNPEYRGIVLSLLGRVVVVENLDSGIFMARKFKYAFRIVTLEGDVINTGGSMTGGSLDSKGTGILSRNREILVLKDEIEKLSGEDKLLEDCIKDLVIKVEEALKEINTVENEIKNNELIRLRDESHLAQIEDNIRKLLARIEMLKQENDQLSRQASDTVFEMEKYLEEQVNIENEIAEAKGIISEFQEKNREEQSVRDSLHADITDYKISVNSILESIEAVKESLNKIAGERDTINKSIERKEKEKNRNIEEIGSLRDTNEGLGRQIKKHDEEKSGKTFEIDRIVEERKMLEEELFELVNQINDINKNILLLNEEFNRIEVKRTKAESEMEAIQNRLWDEYELTYTNALELKKDIGGITQAQKKINEYRNQIKELGPVNVASIEEYIKTRERYEFMTSQHDDMEKAKEKLHRVIIEMISIMKKQFMEQFKLINSNFNLVFKELFDGGRAELIMVDEDNILESGIEIEVQPPGKKLQNMMLLSGGERALTAIALLFAILRLRPTPFCVLDEIEAALDDANVYRFSQYLRRYAKQTQFVMVTHRKGTMEGSDMLYGVTMQEHGISKVVSIKMEEGKAG